METNTSGSAASRPQVLSVTDATGSLDEAQNQLCDMLERAVPASRLRERHQTDARYFGRLRRQSAVESPSSEAASPVQDRHAEEYFMGFPRRGVALILNHVTFHTEQERHGSDLDCKKLERVLGGLGFEVRVKRDLKVTQLLDALKQLSQEDHSFSDCVLVAVLTHGSDRGELFARDTRYPMDCLWVNFTGDRCPSLAGKPKIFIIQACRGSRVDPGVVMVDTSAPRDHVDAPSARNSYTIPTHADILLATATVEGFYAWRNPLEGSWYIRLLCEELTRHADTRDLHTILTFVARRVAVECESAVPDSPRMHQKKQMPCLVSMLTRLVYFRRKRR